MKEDLTIGFLNYAEAFILKNKDNSLIRPSQNVNEKFNFGQFNLNSIIDNLVKIKILNETKKETFHLVDIPQNLTVKQFIFLQWIIHKRPNWMWQFKNGTKYLEDFEESNKNIYQCIKECDVFEKHKSEKTK